MIPPRKPNSAPVNRHLARLAALLTVALTLTTVAATGARAATPTTSRRSRYYKAALAAARKFDGRDTTMSDLKVADGFAVATLLNESKSPQGYLAIFKVQSVRSMTVIASGSDIDPIALVELHMPFATQVKLTWPGSEESLRNAVADEGDYNGESTPGYTGFDGSFGPNGWELDAGTFDSTQAAISEAIHKRNAYAKASEQTIDVDAAYKLNRQSKDTVNKTTYVETFTLKLVFVSTVGNFTEHTLKATQHPGGVGGVPAYFTYALDGHDIG